MFLFCISCLFLTYYLLFQARPIVCKIFAKDFLSDMLDLLELPSAKYRTDVTENDLFIGYCSIYIGRFYRPNDTGRSSFVGEAKATPFDAESSAAFEAIRFLERSKNIELVDFNFDSLIVTRKKHVNLLQLRCKFHAVVSDANRSWSDFAGSLEALVKQQYDYSSHFSIHSGDSSEYDARVRIVADLEEAFSEISNMQHNALSLISSSVN